MDKHSTKAQLPWLLSQFDDRYGITWRVSNAIRRFSLTRTLRFVQGLLTAPSYARPILIIGMPRSGTQMLFHALREHEALGSLPTESHDIWRRFHHPRRNGWASDYVGPGQVRPGERRYVNAHFFAYAGRKRLLSKTADNLVRVRYLLDLFPDATFVVMKRNPCEALNSYINMWKQPGGRFRSYYVPMDLTIPDYPQRRMWCSTLIDGWRRLASAPIEEIAFEQWRQYLDGIEEGRRAVPQSQWVEFFLEDMLEHPDALSHWLFDRLDVAATPAVRNKLSDLLANPINTISPPSGEKWRSQNREALHQLLPRIAERAPTLGCRVDLVTGAFSYESVI
jgi:sulfotransferase family protein